jgi:Leucine-rich repeat (LRR) protein
MLSKVVAIQASGIPKEEVEELILDDWKGTELTASNQALLESFPNLQFLSMNSCGLRSLNHFPQLPKLIKLELNDNKITGGLEKLAGISDLMQINLAGNLLRTLEDIRPLVLNKQTQLTSLVSIDLYDCPVASVPQYRETLFANLPSLEILDHTNKQGEDASLSDEEESEQEDGDKQSDEEDLDDEEQEEEEEGSEGESDPQKRSKP